MTKNVKSTLTEQESADAQVIPPRSCERCRSKAARCAAIAPCKIAGHARARTICGLRICSNAKTRRKTADARKRLLDRILNGCLPMCACSFIFFSIFLFLNLVKLCYSFSITRLGLRGGGPGSQPRHLLPTPADGGPAKSQISKETRKHKVNKKRKRS